jgi:membrane protease YdiL (CAAX protease family)
MVFPRQSLGVWLLILLLYPLLAAYPQEIIFRGFFFQRYGTLFSNQWILILVNGICFGWAHVMYANWIAPVLSTLGGMLFAYRYLKTGSLLIVGIEHGLWGNYLFTLGLGWFFYSGSIPQ